MMTQVFRRAHIPELLDDLDDLVEQQSRPRSRQRPAAAVQGREHGSLPWVDVVIVNDEIATLKYRMALHAPLLTRLTMAQSPRGIDGGV